MQNNSFNFFNIVFFYLWRDITFWSSFLRCRRLWDALYNGVRWCIFRPMHIRFTPLLTYTKSAILYTSDLIAHGFTAA